MLALSENTRVERDRDPGRFPGPGFAGIGKAGIGTGITGIKCDRDRDRDFPVSIIGTGIIPESRFFGPGLGFFSHFFCILVKLQNFKSMHQFCNTIIKVTNFIQLHHHFLRSIILSLVPRKVPRKACPNLL